MDVFQTICLCMDESCSDANILNSGISLITSNKSFHFERQTLPSHISEWQFWISFTRSFSQYNYNSNTLKLKQDSKTEVKKREKSKFAQSSSNSATGIFQKEIRRWYSGFNEYTVLALMISEEHHRVRRVDRG